MDTRDSVREGEGVLQGPALLVRVVPAEQDLVVADQVFETDVEVICSRRELGDASNGATAAATAAAATAAALWTVVVGLDDHFGEEGESKARVDGDGKRGPDGGEQGEISRAPPVGRPLPDEDGGLAGVGVGGSGV